MEIGMCGLGLGIFPYRLRGTYGSPSHPLPYNVYYCCLSYKEHFYMTTSLVLELSISNCHIKEFFYLSIFYFRELGIPRSARGRGGAKPPIKNIFI